MHLPYLLIATALTFAPAIADAGGTEWRRYVIPNTGASIDMPISIFSRDGGPVTPYFFVVSSIRNDRIWYNRCNRGDRVMNCVMINYPAKEKRGWDGVVTRISHTMPG